MYQLRKHSNNFSSYCKQTTKTRFRANLQKNLKDRRFFQKFLDVKFLWESSNL